ncbi:hypothetical protein BDR06DRAFT_962842 [Suillus hirtellus]|nr:hypothetical protein BDR06DRAFT_962842 [Suillus hirtellus]
MLVEDPIEACQCIVSEYLEELAHSTAVHGQLTLVRTHPVLKDLRVCVCCGGCPRG